MLHQALCLVPRMSFSCGLPFSWQFITMSRPRPRLPKINFYSDYVKGQCAGRLLRHQSEALVQLEQLFVAGEDQITVVSMPTGSGKTGVMCCLPYFLGNIGLQRGEEPHFEPTGRPVYRFDKPVLVVAPDLDIAKQLEEQMLVAREDFREQTFLIRRGIVPVEDHTSILPTGVKIEETRDLRHKRYIEGKEIVIANAQKFLGTEWREALPDDTFRLVIVDEAHHHPARTWREIVDRFKGHALVVFFTATPYRADSQLVLDPLPLVYHLKLQSAIADGIIRRTEFRELDGNPGNNPDEMILQEVAALQTKKDALTPLPGGTPHMAIAIAKDTSHANKLVELWNALFPSAPAFAYHTGVNDRQRMAAKRRLQNNELRLIVVVAMLREGFDHPPISIAAITTKIGSPVKFVQFVGRAQRIYRGPEGIEVNGVSDIVTHKHYQQRRNYDNFTNEALIPNA